MTHPNGVQQHRPALLPVYLVVDISASMGYGRRMEAANEIVPKLVEVCERKPTVNDKLRLSLISLGSIATVIVPLGKKDDFLPIPTLSATGGGTNFGSAFRLLRSEIEDGVRTLNAGGTYRVYRPVVFLITDGDATDNEEDRTAAFNELTDAGFKANPHIVVFGVGDASPQELVKYKHRNGAAVVAKAGVEAADALTDLITPLVSSIVASTAGGGDDEATFIFETSAVDNDLFEVYD